MAAAPPQQPQPQNIAKVPLEMRHHTQITEPEGKVLGGRQAAFTSTRLAILTAASSRAFTLYAMPAEEEPVAEDATPEMPPADDTPEPEGEAEKKKWEQAKQRRFFEAVKAKAEEKMAKEQSVAAARAAEAEKGPVVADLGALTVGQQYLVVFNDSDSVGGRKHIFKFWDGASLALEMYAVCAGFTDNRRDQFLGGWLFMAGENPTQNPVLTGIHAAEMQLANAEDDSASSDEKDKSASVPPEPFKMDASMIAMAPGIDLFWSMIIHYHVSGTCLPVGQKDDAPHVIRSEMTDIISKMQKYTEAMKAQGDHKEGEQLPVNVQSKISYALAKFSRRVPCPAFVFPSVKSRRPRWWAIIEFFWTDTLECFIETGKAQCPFGLKPVGCWNKDQCDLQHPEWAVLVQGTAKELAQPLPLLEQIIGGEEHDNEADDENAQTTDAAPIGKLTAQQQRPGVRTCVNPACAQTKDSASFSRCSRCRNVVYCSAACQKTHWKQHKGSCRQACDSNDDDKYPEVWAVVVPGDQGVKPYTVLMPSKAEDGLPFLRNLLKTDDVAMAQVFRGDMRFAHDLRIVFGPRSNEQANVLVSALVKPDDGEGNVVATAGPGVRCRGDAVIIRKPSYVVDEEGSEGKVQRVHVKDEAALVDFTMPMFEDRFGQFSFVPLGDDQASTIIGPKPQQQ